jgi:hypothetical protein
VSDPVDLDALVSRIHDAPLQLVLAITGGGSGAIAKLLTRPGGSRVLLEALVPYSAAALVDFLQATPEQFCSAHTARLMAMAAYQRAMRLAGPVAASVPTTNETLADGGRRFIGVGCTASLASDRPKRGDHRIHVACQTADATSEFSLVLGKGRRSRKEEEDVASTIILNALAQAADLAEQTETGAQSDEPLQVRRVAAEPPWQELLHGGRRQVCAGRVPIIPTGRRRLIFPGAFNPLHEGHRQMAQIASQRLELPTEFEISIHNVDKPPLDYLEMQSRAAQFGDEATVWFTRAATFDEKSRLFPDATFVVGADTIARIAEPAYYGDSERAMLSAVERMTQRGARFLVFGRKAASDDELDGMDSRPEFQTLASLELPSALSAICEEVSETEFRTDISSTQLRHHS